MLKLRFVHIGDAVGQEYQGTDYAISGDSYVDNKLAGKILWTSLSGEHIAYIRYIEVEPDYRRQGIETALLEHLLDSQGFTGWEMLGDFATKEGQAWMKFIRKAENNEQTN